MTFLSRYFIHLLLIVAGFFIARYIIKVTLPVATTITFSFEGQSSTTRLIQFFFTLRDQPTFDEEKSSWGTLDGSKNFQRTSYSLPASLDVTHIRFDLGNAPSNPTGKDTLVVRRVIIDNGSASTSIEVKDLITFSRSPSIASFAEDGTIVNQVAGAYDPYIISGDISSLLADFKFTNDLSHWGTGVFIYLTFVVAMFVSVPPLELSLSKTLFAGSFILVLIIPSLIVVFSREQTTNTEKRELAPSPALSFDKDYPRAFESYFTDHFGLRDELIEAGGRIKVSLFGVSTNSEKVMIGQEGWMFYNNSGGSDFIFDSYTHHDLFTPGELQAYVELKLAQKKTCEVKNIKYFFGFCPQTQTIYPEYMPYFMNVQVRDTLSRAEQIKAALEQSSPDFKMIDLRSSIMEAKSQARLYRKLDSHWNSYGAYIGYKSLFDQIAPEIGVTPYHLSDFDITWVVSDEGDLVSVSGAAPAPDSIPVFSPKSNVPGFVHLTTEGFPAKTFITYCESCPDERTLLIFRDSYTEALEPFISRHFRKVVYAWWRYDQTTVDLVNPDIVIELPVERYL
jgi:hypothetical protein